MINVRHVEFFNLIRGFSGKEYLAAKLLYNTAPVIYGYKPSSIITLSRKPDATYELWEALSEEFLARIKLQCVELRKNEINNTVMFYNKRLLSEAVLDKNNLRFLFENGYERCETLEQFLNVLKQRFQESCPHEVGIFLGIPVEDVKSFVSNCGQNCILCGYWKVYNDLENAKMIFERYNLSKSQVLELVISGEKPTNILFKS